MLTRKRSERSPEFDVYSDFDSFRFRRIVDDGACACARVIMEGGEGPGGHQDIRTSYISHYCEKNTIILLMNVCVCVRAHARARQQGSVHFTRSVN